ncbi:SCO family protein [Robertmurraya andreesenii]|uniref:Protein SCO1/2 n=1 Tax=Anoxybacillus andreesenii TaxID=1325932 RepID=A0ABT9V2D6_9BACL|nr:SCO family protein [Robertmurraya andreesenii]MDQ0155105.1 protein SCO1/2 [Robertmurraya andreesenii]
MKSRRILMALMVLVLLSACGNTGIKDPLNYHIKDFTFTDHEGKKFGLKDLKGKVWVADFIFTNCTTICSPMTFNMAKLQKMAKEEGIENIEFVSFSVDPEVDTPEKLKEYGKNFDLDYSNYHFLTGYDQAFIESFALDNFKALVKKPENEDQVIHQGYFYLVDQKGTIMKYYKGSQDTPFADIITDMKALQ